MEYPKNVLDLQVEKNVSMILGYESPEDVRLACVRDYKLFIDSVRGMRQRVDYYLSENIIRYPRIYYLSELMLYFGFDNSLDLSMFQIRLFGSPKLTVPIWTPGPYSSIIWTYHTEVHRVMQHLHERDKHDAVRNTYRRLMAEISTPK